MLQKEWHKPIGYIIKEWETLCLRKTTIEDISSLALHVYHALERLF